MERSVIKDHQLVSEYVGGNERAFELLVKRHQQKVFGFIIKKVRNEDVANDIFQETFVKVIHTLKSGRYNEEGKFIQWVMRIAHNLVIDHFRKEKRMPTVRPNDEFNVFDILNDGERNAEEMEVFQQILADARKLIDHLPSEQRVVLNMRIYEGMSFKDIAEKTDVSINTALGRMRYALINLRKLIERHEIILTE